MRSRSPGKIKPIPLLLPCPPPQQPRLDGRIATWGEGHAFEYHNTYEGELINSPWPPLLEEQVDANATMEESLLEKIRAASLGWSGSKQSLDEEETTATTVPSPLGDTMWQSSSFSSFTGPGPLNHNSSISTFADFTETLHSDTSIDNFTSMPNSASNVMTFAKTVDKHFAKMYERRLKAMVKDEQRKSKKRVT